MMKKIHILIFFFLSFVSYAGEKLFENGVSEWSVDTCGASHRTLLYAERELQDAVFKISGVRLPSSGTAGHRIILKVDPKMTPDQILLRTQNGNLLISGGSERAVLHAVYAFLQKYLGVRWLWPGKSGEFMPRKKSWELPEIDFSYTPRIKYRAISETGGYLKRQEDVRDWKARNFISVCSFRPFLSRDRERGFYMDTGGHFGISKSYFKEHPEYFAITDGIRHDKQFCFSNPDAIRLVAESVAKKQPYGGSAICGIIPDDNGMLCQCSQCSKMKGSDQWFACFGQIVRHLKKTFPHTEFYTMAYTGFMSPPSARYGKETPFTHLGTFRRCNVHKYGDPGCPTNQKQLQWFDEWKKSGTRFSFYNYDFCLFPWNHAVFAPFYSVIDDAVKTAARYQAVMVSTEVWQGAPKQELRDVEYMKNRLAVYLYAQLMWNPEADCRELIRDWCRTVYGKAADPLYRYFTLLDRQWMSMDTHHHIHGRASNLAPHFVTPELCSQVQALFLEADRLNGGKTEAVEYEKYLFGQWMSLVSPEPRVILPKLEARNSAGNRIGMTSVTAAWNGKELVFRNMKFPFEAEIYPSFAGTPFLFSVDAHGEKHSGAVPVSKWRMENGALSIPVSIFQNVPETGFFWGLRLKSGSEVWPGGGMTSGFMFFSDRDMAGRKVYWSRGRGKYGDAYDREMKNQFLNMGWDFYFAEKELFEREDFSVYVFCHNNSLQAGFAPEMWPKIWEKVKNGAMLVIQPAMHMNFAKITEDETLHFLTRGMGKTPMGRTAKYLSGEWLLKPYDLQKEFKRCITPAYTAIPKHPEAWQVLADQPKSFAEKEVRDPFVLFRPYGKGFVAVFCFGNYAYFSPAVLIGNLYENREALRGKSLWTQK